MTVIAWWRTADTRPGVLIPLGMGTDPLTGLLRVLDDEDEVTLIMRPPGGPAMPRATTVVSLGSTTDPEDPPSVWWKPEDGDLDDPGLYAVVTDITDSVGDVETFPDREAVAYEFLIGAKPGDED